jgi:hypothetical protein
MVLLRAAANRRVIRVIQDTHVMTQMFGYRTDTPAAWVDPPAFAAENLRVHRDVYEAVCRRDPKAARRAMAAHMRRARKNMLDRFDWLRRQGDLDSSPAGEFPESMRQLVGGIQRQDLTDLPSHSGPAPGKGAETDLPRSD